jgi:antiviral helicase SKI2
MSNADCEGPLSEAESVKSEVESVKSEAEANEAEVSSSANEPDLSGGANEPELSLLDDILSVESASRSDGISDGAGRQPQEVTSSNVNSIMLFASGSASFHCCMCLLFYKFIYWQAWAIIGGSEGIAERFHELVPDMALEFPFELDKFQKEVLINANLFCHLIR